MSEPGTRKCRSISVASDKGCSEKRSVQCSGRRKNTAERKIVMTPTSEPNVPGAFGAYPTPSAVAMAIARRGFSFWLGVSALAVIGLIQVQNNRLALAVGLFHLFFVKNRVGDDVLFARPVTQVLHAAAFAAKWEIFVYSGIG